MTERRSPRRGSRRRAAVAPHYESYFLKAHHPAEPRALWLRHTVHQRPGEPKTASLWLTLFDAPLPTPVRAGKVTVGGGRAGRPADGLYRASAAAERRTRSRARRARLARRSTPRGTSRSDRRRAELRHLPADWMYGATLPQTKSRHAAPGRAFQRPPRQRARRQRLGAACSATTGAREHAERWIWMHCGQFEGRGRTRGSSSSLGRVRVGPRRPPVARQRRALARRRAIAPRRPAPRPRDEGRRDADTARASSSPATASASRARSPRPRDRSCWRYADPDRARAPQRALVDRRPAPAGAPRRRRRGACSTAPRRGLVRARDARDRPRPRGPALRRRRAR